MTRTVPRLLPWSLSLFVHLALFLALFLASRPLVSDLTAVDLDFSSAPPGISLVSAALPEEWRMPRNITRTAASVPPSLARAAAVPSGSTEGEKGSDGSGGPNTPRISQPPRFKEQMKALYPEAARRGNVEGVVVLQVEIDAAGAVKKVDLVQGLGYGCDEAAVDAAEHSTFTPAFAGEEPVPVRIRIPYRFKFEN